MSCDTFFVLSSPRKRIAKKRSGSLKPTPLNNNTLLEPSHAHHRPNSWSGVFQKLVPRRSAPPPPPDKTSQLYSEISKGAVGSLPRADTGEYDLADDVDNTGNWIYENPGKCLPYTQKYSSANVTLYVYML